MNKSHKEVSETWFRRVWTEQDESAIDDMLVPETKARGLNDSTLPPRTGPEEFKVFHRLLLGVIDEVYVHIEHLMSEGDWASVLCRLEAVSRVTREKVEMRGHVLVKIIDGKLVDAHNHFDFISLFEQLKLMPNNAFSTCIGGNKIA